MLVTIALTSMNCSAGNCSLFVLPLTSMNCSAGNCSLFVFPLTSILQLIEVKGNTAVLVTVLCLYCL